MFNNISYETALWNSGLKYVAGVDEVGRGSFAGPLVTAAVVWSPEIATLDKNHKMTLSLLEIKDSKKLTSKKREKLSTFIKNNCFEYTIIEVSSKEIDKYGVGEINKKALRDAVIKLKKSEHVLVDHFSIFSKQEQKNVPNLQPASKSMTITETSIRQGDAKSISIASASIIAKVYRDNLMKTKYHSMYPQYGFDSHVGYGTKKHKEAIKVNGLCPIHRKSFKIR